MPGEKRKKKASVNTPASMRKGLYWNGQPAVSDDKKKSNAKWVGGIPEQTVLLYSCCIWYTICCLLRMSFPTWLMDKFLIILHNLLVIKCLLRSTESLGFQNAHRICQSTANSCYTAFYFFGCLFLITISEKTNLHKGFFLLWNFRMENYRAWHISDAQ